MRRHDLVVVMSHCKVTHWWTPKSVIVSKYHCLNLLIVVL